VRVARSRVVVRVVARVVVSLRVKEKGALLIGVRIDNSAMGDNNITFWWEVNMEQRSKPRTTRKRLQFIPPHESDPRTGVCEVS
jgi:hypothetical protein